MVLGRIIITVLFVLFAAFQINDPDPWQWMALYGYIAVMGALGHFNIRTRPFILGGMLVCLIWMAFLLPDFIRWIRMGMPSIVDQMKAEEAHIELVREFLGLILSLFALWLLYRFDKKTRLKTLQS